MLRSYTIHKKAATAHPPSQSNLITAIIINCHKKTRGNRNIHAQHDNVKWLVTTYARINVKKLSVSHGALMGFVRM